MLFGNLRVCVVSGLRRSVNESFPLLDVMQRSTDVPMFQDNLSIPTSRVKQFNTIDCFTLEDGTDFCPETPITNYQSKRGNIPEQRRSQPQGKRPLGRPDRVSEGNIKTELLC